MQLIRRHSPASRLLPTRAVHLYHRATLPRTPLYKSSQPNLKVLIPHATLCRILQPSKIQHVLLKARLDSASDISRVRTESAIVCTASVHNNTTWLTSRACNSDIRERKVIVEITGNSGV